MRMTEISEVDGMHVVLGVTTNVQVNAHNRLGRLERSPEK